MTDTYLRLDVPSTTVGPTAVPSSPAKPGSGRHYIRLGAYIDPDEAKFLPNLKFTKSTSTDQTTTAPSADEDTAKTVAEGVNATTSATGSGQYQNAVLAGKSGNVKNKNSQMELTTISTTTQETSSDGSGILLNTTDDVNVNAGGGIAMKAGSAVTIHAAGGDILMSTPLGAMRVLSEEGVSITAGSASNPANISLLAYGYVKQEAKGPLSDYRYATSETRTYGWTKDWFYGEKYSEVHGTNISKFYGVSESYNLAEIRSYSLAGRLTCNLSGSLTFNMSFDLTFTASIQLTLAASLQATFIAGIRLTAVILDLKSAKIDFKNVFIDGKLATYKYESKIIAMQYTNATSLWGGLMEMRKNLAGIKSGELEVDQKALKVVVAQQVNN